MLSEFSSHADLAAAAEAATGMRHDKWSQRESNERGGPQHPANRNPC